MICSLRRCPRLIVRPRSAWSANWAAGSPRKGTRASLRSMCSLISTPARCTCAWHLTDGGTLTFDRVSNDWHEITGEDEAFFMRVYPPGDFRFHGADLGILVTKGRMQTADGLTERCRRYIEGIRAHYQSEVVPDVPAVMPIAYVK